LSRICKLLLVEDRDDDIVLFQRALQRHSNIMLTGTARDGDAAIAYLQGAGQYADRTKHPWPDVVVLDLKLPGRSGFEVLKWMQGQNPRPKVAIFTSSVLPEDKVKAEQLGADLYEQKTLKAEEFDRFIHWLHKFSELNDREAEERG
jgi:CheY-like chemotaxis protein